MYGHCYLMFFYLTGILLYGHYYLMFLYLTGICCFRRHDACSSITLWLLATTTTSIQCKMTISESQREVSTLVSVEERLKSTSQYKCLSSTMPYQCTGDIRTSAHHNLPCPNLPSSGHNNSVQKTPSSDLYMPCTDFGRPTAVGCPNSPSRVADLPPSNFKGTRLKEANPNCVKDCGFSQDSSPKSVDIKNIYLNEARGPSRRLDAQSYQGCGRLGCNTQLDTTLRPSKCSEAGQASSVSFKSSNYSRTPCLPTVLSSTKLNKFWILILALTFASASGK